MGTSSRSIEYVRVAASGGCPTRCDWIGNFRVFWVGRKEENVTLSRTDGLRVFDFGLSISEILGQGDDESFPCFTCRRAGGYSIIR